MYKIDIEFHFETEEEYNLLKNFCKFLSLLTINEQKSIINNFGPLRKGSDIHGTDNSTENHP